MKQYIAVVGALNSVVTKYQDFDTEVEADIHVEEHGGFVAQNPGGNPAYWVINAGTLLTDQARRDADLVDNQWRYLRTERDRRLSRSDWRFVVDVQTSQEWADYRQALRDLPSLTVDPANPVWPTEPTT